MMMIDDDDSDGDDGGDGDDDMVGAHLFTVHKSKACPSVHTSMHVKMFMYLLIKEAGGTQSSMRRLDIVKIRLRLTNSIVQAPGSAVSRMAGAYSRQRGTPVDSGSSPRP